MQGAGAEAGGGRALYIQIHRYHLGVVAERRLESPRKNMGVFLFIDRTGVLDPGNYRLDRIHIVRITMLVCKIKFRYL